MPNDALCSLFLSFDLIGSGIDSYYFQGHITVISITTGLRVQVSRVAVSHVAHRYIKTKPASWPRGFVPVEERCMHLGPIHVQVIAKHDEPFTMEDEEY